MKISTEGLFYTKIQERGGLIVKTLSKTTEEVILLLFSLQQFF